MIRKDKGRLPPFVPLFIATLDSRAWGALSHGARSLYVALKRQADHAHNTAYLSTRVAARKLISGRDKVREWFAELEHYGFIVMIAPGHLGSDGMGKAPHWRLTEKGTTRGGYEAPTNDFLKWDGTPFDAKQYRREDHREPPWEKQNPGPDPTARVVVTPRPPLDLGSRPGSGQGGPDPTAIHVQGGGPDHKAITSLTTTRGSNGYTPRSPASNGSHHKRPKRRSR
jgi:hypothetical protein